MYLLLNWELFHLPFWTAHGTCALQNINTTSDPLLMRCHAWSDTAGGKPVKTGRRLSAEIDRCRQSCSYMGPSGCRLHGHNGVLLKQYRPYIPMYMLNTYMDRIFLCICSIHIWTVYSCVSAQYIYGPIFLCICSIHIWTVYPYVYAQYIYGPYIPVYMLNTYMDPIFLCICSIHIWTVYSYVYAQYIYGPYIPRICSIHIWAVYSYVYAQYMYAVSVCNIWVLSYIYIYI
jgi:hypothetical protein